MELKELQTLSRFFNEGGYVFDFSNRSFNEFTEGSIGVRIQDATPPEYSSKGKSLDYFFKSSEYSESQKAKLITDLLYYYDNLYTDKGTNEIQVGLYSTVNLISEKYSKNKVIGEQNYLEYFNEDYISRSSDLMINSIEDDPTIAIGKAKELVESCFKYILDKENIEYQSNSKISELRKEVFKYLDLLPNENKAAVANNSVKRILAGLIQIIDGINELRNIHGDGHGKGMGYVSLPPGYAQLVVESAITIVNFTWETYIYRKQVSN